MLGNQESKGCSHCTNSLSSFFTARTRSFYDWSEFKKVPWQKLLIGNNAITNQLSTIIYDTMWQKHITISSVDLLHELNVFTTRVKTKTVLLLGYSTSNIFVQHKSLRYSLIPCQLLLFIFLFFVIPVVNFFTARTRSKISTKKTNIREIPLM